MEWEVGGESSERNYNKKVRDKVVRDKQREKV